MYLPIRLEIPLSIPSRSNTRDHPQVAGRKAKRQRVAVRDALRLHCGSCELDDDTELDVLLVRVSADELDRHDNLPGALKSAADAVQDYTGIDDRSSRLRFRYGQTKDNRGLPGYQAVRVTIAKRESCLWCGGSLIALPPKRREAMRRGMHVLEVMQQTEDEVIAKQVAAVQAWLMAEVKSVDNNWSKAALLDAAAKSDEIRCALMVGDPTLDVLQADLELVKGWHSHGQKG